MIHPCVRQTQTDGQRAKHMLYAVACKKREQKYHLFIVLFTIFLQ